LDDVGVVREVAMKVNSEAFTDLANQCIAIAQQTEDVDDAAKLLEMARDFLDLANPELKRPSPSVVQDDDGGRLHTRH
jgi:hypothetical protein